MEGLDGGGGEGGGGDGGATVVAGKAEVEMEAGRVVEAMETAEMAVEMVVAMPTG